MSFRMGSLAGLLDLTDAWHGGSIAPARAHMAAAQLGEMQLDRGQRLDQHVAHHGQALGRDLVHRVLGRVPRRVVEVDQERGRARPGLMSGTWSSSTGIELAPESGAP